MRARAGALLDEALALEDDFAVVTDKLAWRRKDIERAAARGRASVRSAFARVRAQLADRESELLESLDTYESDSLKRLERGTSDHEVRLGELRRLQESLRARCRDGDPVPALNAYAAAKAAIVSLRESFRQDEMSTAAAPEEFIGLAGSARAELDLHAEGLASLEEAVASLCERGAEFQAEFGRDRAGGMAHAAGSLSGPASGLGGGGGGREPQPRREVSARDRESAPRANVINSRKEMLGQHAQSQRFREDSFKDSLHHSRPVIGPPLIA